VKVLVTGADGFIGRHLCVRLERRGHAVTRTVRDAPSDPGQSNTIVTGDLADFGGLPEALAGHDAVVHLAGRAHVLHETAPDPAAQYQRTNVDATLNVARAAEAAATKRFVFLSTIGVHGDRSNHSLTENDPLAPAEPYAHSKVSAERALADVHARGRLEVVVLRPTLTYGPGCHGNMARLVQLVARGTPLPFASVHALRSFIGVENLGGLIELALTHPAAAGETFVAADGEDIALPDLLRQIAAGLGVRSHLFPFPRVLLELAAGVAGHRKALDKLTASLRVDASKARHRLGWSPDVPLAVGLRAMAASFRKDAAGPSH
jgi:nucleoside-diphosphate-sugar epimerase